MASSSCYDSYGGTALVLGLGAVCVWAFGGMVAVLLTESTGWLFPQIKGTVPRLAIGVILALSCYALIRLFGEWGLF